MNLYRLVHTRVTTYYRVKRADIAKTTGNRFKLNAKLRSQLLVNWLNHATNFGNAIRFNRRFDWSNLSLLCALMVAYKYGTLLYSSKQGTIVKFKAISDDGVTLNSILNDCEALVEDFKPSYLLMSGITQTLFSGFLKCRSPGYDHEILKMSDGGQIKLEYMNIDANTKGIITVIPGLCGDGRARYAVNVAKQAVSNGYGVIIINHRGCADTELLTPVTYHGGSNFDTKEALAYIQEKYPEQLLYGVGISLGANILSKYLGDEGENSCLAAAALICSPLDPMESSRYSEKSCFGLISRYLATGCKNIIKKNPEVIPMFKSQHNIDFEHVIKNVKKLRHYDDIVTSIMFGYKDVVDYYSSCNTVPLLKKIKTKAMFISSMDDPFFGPDIIPYEEFEKNENIYLIATRCGGHIGFYESVFSANQWFTKPVFKFFNHLNSLQTSNLTSRDVCIA